MEECQTVPEGTRTSSEVHRSLLMRRLPADLTTSVYTVGRSSLKSRGSAWLVK
jgi:hypothetical protein